MAKNKDRQKQKRRLILLLLLISVLFLFSIVALIVSSNGVLLSPGNAITNVVIFGFIFFMAVLLIVAGTIIYFYLRI